MSTFVDSGRSIKAPAWLILLWLHCFKSWDISLTKSNFIAQSHIIQLNSLLHLTNLFGCMNHVGFHASFYWSHTFLKTVGLEAHQNFLLPKHGSFWDFGSFFSYTASNHPQFYLTISYLTRIQGTFHAFGLICHQTVLNFTQISQCWLHSLLSPWPYTDMIAYCIARCKFVTWLEVHQKLSSVLGLNCAEFHTNLTTLITFYVKSFWISCENQQIWSLVV